MKITILCTICPFGCQMEVEHDSKTIFSVIGNRCKKGLEYVEQEIFNPRRIITTTVRIFGSLLTLVPVKTHHSVPKQLSFEIIQAASRMQLQAPVKRGDIVIKNIFGTGANLVVTRSIEKIS